MGCLVWRKEPRGGEQVFDAFVQGVLGNVNIARICSIVVWPRLAKLMQIIIDMLTVFKSRCRTILRWNPMLPHEGSIYHCSILPDRVLWDVILIAINVSKLPPQPLWYDYLTANGVSRLLSSAGRPSVVELGQAGYAPLGPVLLAMLLRDRQLHGHHEVRGVPLYIYIYI